MNAKQADALERLTTEAANPASAAIDALSALEIVRLMNAEDAAVPAAVAETAESVAAAVDVIADRLRNGGRLIYLGAGTSGRLGVLDASESPPTFSTPPEMVVGLIAGGRDALTRAIEGAEDHPEAAERDLSQIALSAGDVVVGIATSGRTPYVLGGLQFARSCGAFAIGLSCNAGSELEPVADLMIVPVVGPEVVSGSTRLKAGTATKLVLNMLTTGAMVRLGKTFGNVMVDLRATNAKLTARSRRIVSQLADVDADEAQRLLADCDGEVKTAIVVKRRNLSPERARDLLRQSGGHLRQALVAESPEAPAAATTQRRTATGGLILGVDGGGSKTVAWIASAADGERILGRGIAGPSNPQTVGAENAVRELQRAVEAAFVDAGLPTQRFASVCLGMAGVDREPDRDVVEQWAARTNLTERLQIVNDALPVLFAAHPDGCGAAIISGTGSLAFGRRTDGRTARAGGWGWLFGDEGSGYAVAVAGLRAAATAADGRGPATTLLDRFLAALNCRRPEELISAVYRPGVARAELAELCPVVFDAARENDAVAAEIVDQAAGGLADMAAAVAAQLEFGSTPFPLATTGGVLLHHAELQRRLCTALRDRGFTADTVVPVPNPVRGSLILARQAASPP